MNISRNILGLTLAASLLSLASAHAGSAAGSRGGVAKPIDVVAKPIAIKVYKTPSCGCCKAWVQHLRANGFRVESMDMPDLSLVKQRYGVTPALQACHTGIVNGYVIEGHVPADVIKKLLREHPAVAGVAVPGMPAGSPGMEGGSKEPYDVLAFDRAGRTKVFAHR